MGFSCQTVRGTLKFLHQKATQILSVFATRRFDLDMYQPYMFQLKICFIRAAALISFKPEVGLDVHTLCLKSVSKARAIAV